MTKAMTTKKRVGKSRVTTQSEVPRGAPAGRAPSRAPMTSNEENVVRMRHGFSVPAKMELGTKDGGSPELRAKLQELERHALSGGAAQKSARATTKSKIVSALRSKT